MADGLTLRFGDATITDQLLLAIAGRQGLGNLLAEGSRLAAAQLGGGSEAWAMHVKGLELPGYDPRGLKTLALGLATTPRGACHNRTGAYEVDFSGTIDRFVATQHHGQLAAAAEATAAVLDSLTVCKFIRHCFDDLFAEGAALYQAVTGLPLTGAELALAGRRIITLKRLFNLRHGWQPADDTLPARLLDEPLADGPGAGERLTRAELAAMIASYYAAHSWQADGTIPATVLTELGLTADGLAGSAEPSQAAHISQVASPAKSP
jgi:aldehyde:ferredoxin oxidoreductase